MKKKTVTTKTVYGLFYRKRLALLDGRVPLFWRRSVADLYNKTHLAGKGAVKPVEVKTGLTSLDGEA